MTDITHAYITVTVPRSAVPDPVLDWASIAIIDRARVAVFPRNAMQEAAEAWLYPDAWTHPDEVAVHIVGQMIATTPEEVTYEAFLTL